MAGFSRSVQLTPILCPLSLTRGKFLDGSDLTWPVARSRRGTLADPRNLTGEKHNANCSTFWISILKFYEVMRTWKILKSCHNTKLPVYFQFILPFTLHCNQTVSIIASTSWRVLSHHCDQWSDSGGQNHGRHITSNWITRHTYKCNVYMFSNVTKGAQRWSPPISQQTLPAQANKGTSWTSVQSTLSASYRPATSPLMSNQWLSICRFTHFLQEWYNWKFYPELEFVRLYIEHLSNHSARKTGELPQNKTISQFLALGEGG